MNADERRLRINSICVYRVSGANGRLQGMKPQMKADFITRDETADERG